MLKYSEILNEVSKLPDEAQIEYLQVIERLLDAHHIHERKKLSEKVGNFVGDYKRTVNQLDKKDKTQDKKLENVTRETKERLLALKVQMEDRLSNEREDIIKDILEVRQKFEEVNGRIDWTQKKIDREDQKLFNTIHQEKFEILSRLQEIDRLRDIVKSIPEQRDIVGSEFIKVKKLKNRYKIEYTGKQGDTIIGSTGFTESKANAKFVKKAGDTMTGDLDFVGKGINTADYVDFDLTATSGAKAGRMRWNNTDRCLEYDSYVDGTIATNQLGQETWIRVRNNTGSEIGDGKAVYVTGALGNRPTIALARADDPNTTKNFIGITTQAIPNNDDGFVTVIGSVRGLNTNSFTAGDTVWLSTTTAGELQNTMPEAPNCKVKVGYVTVKNVANGEILVESMLIPRLSQLSDVAVTSIADKDILRWNGTTERFENNTTDIYKTYSGFVNRTDSTIAIDGSGNFTITPVSPYTIYTNGHRHIIDAPQTVQATEDQTITYIYLMLMEFYKNLQRRGTYQVATTLLLRLYSRTGLTML
jgi:hypothetical protein